MRKIWGWLLAAGFICMPCMMGYAEGGQTLADMLASGNVTLSGNIAVSNSITISGKKTLDLNGRELEYTGSGSLFIVGSGAELTIQDSASDTKEERDQLISRTSANVAQVASYADGSGELTWYETQSVIQPDGYHTVETQYRCTASGLGRIIAAQTGTEIQPLISVTNGGKLFINGGAIYGAKNHAVSLEGTGTAMTMSGGYLLGNTASKGGAVLANNAALTMSGGVMSGNMANGVSRNEWEAHFGGGAVCLEGTANFQMTGGMLTNNVAESDYYFDGGGAVLVNGNATFQMGNAQMSVSQPTDMIQITGNKAGSGGGVRTGWNQRTTFTMNDGIIAGNLARTAEGGGVSVNMQGVGYVYKGFVTNNRTETEQHWGGGGLFCSDGSSLVMNGTLITGNTAGGFGGGIGGCSTGRIDTVALDISEYGAAIFGNSAQGINLSGETSTKSADHLYADQSPVFRANGYQDFFCALSSYVADRMLGGGSANWKGSMDGKPVVIPKNGQMLATYIAGLTANPTDADKQAAISKAKSIASPVYVTGNHSNTHGGAILCNGYLLFGPSSERKLLIGDQLEIEGVKLLLDGLTLEPLDIREGDYRFSVKDQNGYVVSSGKNLESGDIVFDRMLSFADKGIYKYTIQEEAGDQADGIVMDGAQYKLTVTVSEYNSSGNVFSISFNKITHVKLEKVLNGSTKVMMDDEVEDSGESSAYHLNLFFDNYKTYTGHLTVKKVWEGNGNHPESIVVRLKQGGKVVDEQKLSGMNGWTYTWKNLDNKNGVYTVEEDTPQGYSLTRTVHQTPVFGEKSYWVPADKFVFGRQYMIVSPDGDQALWIDPNQTNNAMTTASKRNVSISEGELRIGDRNYSQWYDDKQIAANSIFTPKRYNEEGLKLQNVGTAAYMLAEENNGNFLKTAGTSPNYGSFFSFDQNVLMATEKWDKNAEKRPVVYQAEKFNTVESSSVSDTVRLYMLVRDPISSDILVTLTNTFDPTTMVIDLPQTGDESRIFVWIGILIGALAVMVGINRKTRKN